MILQEIVWRKSYLPEKWVWEGGLFWNWLHCQPKNWSL